MRGELRNFGRLKPEFEGPGRKEKLPKLFFKSSLPHDGLQKDGGEDRWPSPCCYGILILRYVILLL